MRNVSYTLFRDSELLGILLTLATLTIIIYFIFQKIPDHGKKHGHNTHESDAILPFVRMSRPKPVYEKKDWFAITLITVFYAVISLWQLGGTTFPTSTWQPVETDGSQEFILELTEDTHFDAIYAIYEEGDNNNNPDTWQLGDDHITLYGSNDLSYWKQLVTLEKNGIYEYNIQEGDWNYQYVKFICTSKNDTLTEIAFRSSDAEAFLPVAVYHDDNMDSQYPASLVIDEQDLLFLNPTYINQGYFDEVYHPRNAWEIANGQYMYATVHPLFGTNLIALAIKLFGMNPLSWRIMGALTGIAMVPLMYGLLKLIFHKRRYAVIGSILFAADFMHITTSRIGTLEPFSVFGIMLMFYFMFVYYYSSFYDTDLIKQLKILLACGISMGVAFATKWTACYSAVGLAILLFANLISRYLEYRKAKQLSENEEEKAELNEEQLALLEKITGTFRKNFWVTIGWCFVFFIFIPAVIYWVSYLPDHVWRDGWSIANVWKQNEYMYNYHMNLDATHPYSSTWYMWIVDARPIWYYYGTDGNGWSHSISCFSNPLLTWMGLIAFLFTLYETWKKKDQTGFALLTGYITALAPWVLFVKRCCFAYHFYPSSIFLILIVTYFFRYLLETDGKKWKKPVVVFLCVYVLLFVAFLPVTCGFGTSLNYIKACEWFPSWYFG